MTMIKNRKPKSRSVTGIIAVMVLSVFFSSNSLAKLNSIQRIYTQEGYPYADLLRRSEQVNLIYSQSDNEVSCRVEISSDGEVFKGKEQVAKLKHFKDKPLHSCLARPMAKILLAKTY